jgi:hypothetical protein
MVQPMAKAKRKTSTSAPRGKTRRGVLRYLPELLKSSAIPLSALLAPLPRLEWDQAGKLTLTTSDGTETFVREKEPVSPQAPQPPAKLIETEVWFKRALKDHSPIPGQSKSAYARDLKDLMEAAPVTKQWQLTSIRRRLYPRSKRGKS